MQRSIKLPAIPSFILLFLNSQRGKKTMFLSYYKDLCQNQNYCIKQSEQRKEVSLILQSRIYVYFLLYEYFKRHGLSSSGS